MATNDTRDGSSTATSVLFAGAIGGLAGAALAGRRGVRAGLLGATVGAAGLGASEAVARARQRPGEIPALWQRIAVSAALAAPLGWVAGRLTRALPRGGGWRASRKTTEGLRAFRESVQQTAEIRPG